MTINITSQDQEEQIKQLRRLLEGWRVALLTLKSVLMWEQQWHPGAIFGTVTLLYLLVWLMDLSTIATIAVVGLILNFVDFIVPFICNMLYGPTAWTGQQEKMFIDICKSIVASYNKTLGTIRNYYSLRETSPAMYYLISLSMLCTLMWVASSINNTFLLYILTTVMLLWPGLQQTGIFNSVSSLLNLAPKMPWVKTE